MNSKYKSVKQIKIVRPTNHSKVDKENNPSPG